MKKVGVKKKNKSVRKIFDNFHEYDRLLIIKGVLVQAKAGYKLHIDGLAKATNSSARYLYLIKYGRPAGPHLVLKLEKETNGILNRHLLRPDIFGSQ